MKRVIATHPMADDVGNIYRINEVQEYVAAKKGTGPTYLAGEKRFELPDGSPVKVIDENTFEIVKTRKIVRRA